MTKQFHYVYKTTNLLSNKFYIGKHSASKLENRYFGSSVSLLEDIKKLGKENFIKEILKQFSSAESAFQYEKELITEDLIISELCYNLHPGGKGASNGEHNSICKLSKQGKNPSTVAKQQGKYTWGHKISKGQKELVEKGVHHLQGPNGLAATAKRNGTFWTENRAKEVQNRIAQGTNLFCSKNHPSKFMRPWEFPSNTETSILAWKNADLILDIYQDNECGCRKLAKLCKKKLNLDFTTSPLQTMIKKFNSGWVPKNDTEWIKFKNGV